MLSGYVSIYLNIKNAPPQMGHIFGLAMTHVIILLSSDHLSVLPYAAHEWDVWMHETLL